jgi:hypothetical protein
VLHKTAKRFFIQDLQGCHMDFKPAEYSHKEFYDSSSYVAFITDMHGLMVLYNLKSVEIQKKVMSRWSLIA